MKEEKLYILTDYQNDEEKYFKSFEQAQKNLITRHINRIVDHLNSLNNHTDSAMDLYEKTLDVLAKAFADMQHYKDFNEICNVGRIFEDSFQDKE